MSLSPSDTFWSLAVYFHGVAEYFHLIFKILTIPKSGPSDSRGVWPMELGSPAIPEPSWSLRSGSPPWSASTRRRKDVPPILPSPAGAAGGGDGPGVSGGGHEAPLPGEP